MGTPQIPSIDSDSKQFPDAVRARMAANLADPATPEGIVLGNATVANVPVQNATYVPMTKWFTAKAKADAGVANAKVLCIGDSKTWGYPLQPDTAWPALMLPRLNLRSAVSTASVLPGTTFGLDSSWTVPSPWQINYGPGGGALFSNPGNTQAAVYKPTYVCDTVDVWSWKGNGKGSLIVTVNGTPTTVDNFSTTFEGWVKTTIPMTRGTTNTVSLTLNASGAGQYINVFLDAYDSTTKSIRVANWGVSGSTAAGWNSILLSKEAVTAWAPDLTFIELGTNDAQAGTSVANWQTAVSAIIDAAKVTGDVILVSNAQSQPTSVAALEQAYRDASPALATTKDIAFIDVLKKLGPWQSALYADTLHPNTRGQAAIARIMAAGLRAL